MHRRKAKGQITPMDFFMIALVFFIGVGFLIAINFLAARDMIISKQSIYISMDIDDKGSEMLSLLSSTSSGLTHMRIMGDSLAANDDDYSLGKFSDVDSAVDKLGKGYSLYFGKYSKETTKSTAPCVNDDTFSHSKDLLWPMPSVTSVSSKPGWRLHPIENVCKCHAGVDVPGGGHSVIAALSGTVNHAGQQSGYGNSIEITHDGDWQGYTTFYAHLDELKVAAGQRITQGQEIGISGDSGLSSGAHLHFELRKGTMTLDPCLYIEGAPHDCSVLDRCIPEGTAAQTFSAYVPVPGAQATNLVKEVRLVRI